MIQNYCVHIYTTNKNHDRCEWIEKTYGQYIFNLIFYTDIPIDNSRYICCTKDDSYDSHMKKNFYAINNAFYSKDLKNIDWHYFIGDDTFLYHYNLEKLLPNLDAKENSIFGEYLAPGVGYGKLGYIGGGGGLLLNRVSLQSIIKNDSFTDSEKKEIGFSDAVVGLICQKANVLLSNQPGFHTHPPRSYGITNPEEHISFHYIKDRASFDYLYSRYLNK